MQQQLVMIKKVIYKQSPENKPQKQAVTKYNQRTYGLQKSFKKREKLSEKQQPNSPQNTLKKNFRRSKQNQQRTGLSPNNYIKIQQNRPVGSRQVSKISLKDDLYKSKEIFTPISKIKIIADILLKQLNNQPYLILEQLYQRNERLEQILCDWQKKELYEQTDKLIYRISQFYISVIETVMQKSFSAVQNALEKCEDTIKELQAQNSELKNFKINNSHNQNIVNGLKVKLMQQKEKNQWASIFLSTFSTLNFDTEAFLKQNLLLTPENSEKMGQSNMLDHERIARHVLLLKREHNSQKQMDVIKKINSEGHIQQRQPKSVISSKEYSLK